MLEVFHPLREYYLRCYRQSLAEARGTLADVVAELMLEPNGSTELEPVHRIYRVDIFGTGPEGHGIREVNVEPTTLPARLTGYSVPVFLSPLVWNGVEVQVEGGDLPYPELLQWGAFWLDLEDARYNDKAEFQGVIHSFMRPEQMDSGWAAAIDLGSAPVAALHELLVFASRTAQAIRVGSSTYCGESTSAGA